MSKGRAVSWVCDNTKTARRLRARTQHSRVHDIIGDREGVGFSVRWYYLKIGSLLKKETEVESELSPSRAATGATSPLR
jgi:hypothetical protein